MMTENKKTNIHKNHRKRFREELRRTGIEHMNDHRILEFLLFHAHTQKDVNPLAHNLINKFGSLANVLEASFEQLIKVDGIGESSATLITFLLPILERYKNDKANVKIKASTTLDYVKQFGPLIENEPYEKNLLIILNDKYEVYKHFVLNCGNLDSVDVKCTEIFDHIKNTKCRKIILLHNHPSGNPKPSPADLLTTRILLLKLKVLEIQFVDNIIISTNGYLSFKEERILEDFEKNIDNEINSLKYGIKPKN